MSRVGTRSSRSLRGVREAAGAMGHEAGADEALGRRAARYVAREERARAGHVGKGFHPARLESLRIPSAACRPIAGLIGPGARVRDDQLGRHVRVSQGEVEGDVASHGQAADGRPADLQVRQETVEVLHGAVLGVRGRIFRGVGDPMSAHVIGDDAARS